MVLCGGRGWTCESFQMGYSTIFEGWGEGNTVKPQAFPKAIVGRLEFAFFTKRLPLWWG